MIGAENLLIRAVYFAMLLVVFLPLLKVADDRFKGHQKALFRFFLVSYLVTYFAGASIIYLLGETAFLFYFNTVIFTPSSSDIDFFFLLSLFPFISIVLISMLPGRKVRDDRTNIGNSNLDLVGRSPFSLTALTAMITLALSVILLGSNTPRLIASSFDVSSARHIHDLYEARASAMSGMSFIQGGLLYGTLPALTSGLLLYVGSYSRLIKVVAYFSLGLTVILNLGLHQAAPLFALGFIYLTAKIFLGRGNTWSARAVILVILLFVAYIFYASIKSTRVSVSILAPLFDIVMRMPVAGPYLVSMHEANIGFIVDSDYIPRSLGYFMFPEFAARYAHISMPQPSFMVSWYFFGAISSIAMFTASTMVAFFLVKRLAAGVSSRFGFSSVIVCYSFFHFVYYSFQTSHFEVLISSYGVIFPLLPAFIFSGLRLFLRPYRVARPC